MKEIKDIGLTHMNNGAHFTFVGNILARAEKDATVKAKAADQVAALKKAFEAEDAALKISQKSLITDDIAQADSERDALYTGYKKAVNGFLTLPAADMAKAAKVLAQHIKDYNIDPKEQLDRETGMLVNFISDLETRYKEQVETLALTPFVNGMKSANERVRTLTLERTEERMTQTVGAMKAARNASDEAYNQLVRMVNALALVFGDTDYANFIDYVNTEITHYKREVLNQKASATGGSTEGGSTEGGGNGGNEGGGTPSEPDTPPSTGGDDDFSE